MAPGGVTKHNASARSAAANTRKNDKKQDLFRRILFFLRFLLDI